MAISSRYFKMHPLEHVHTVFSLSLFPKQHSIITTYIALGTVNNLEMTESVQEDYGKVI